MRNSTFLIIYCVICPLLFFGQVDRNWTWVAGASQVNQEPIASGPDATPGARAGAATWSDKKGQLWLFGGYRVVGSDVKYYNDLWCLNYATKTWRLVKGTLAANQSMWAGAAGALNNAFMPGARAQAASCMDAEGNLWLFGGIGYAAKLGSVDQKGYLADLWKYDVSTGYWIYVGGPKSINRGVFGAANAFGAEYTPGGRTGMSMWISNNTIWFFGGSGNPITSERVYADVWRFRIATGEWGQLVNKKPPPPPPDPNNPTPAPYPDAKSPNFLGVYPAQYGTGTYVWPPARSNFTSWVDNNGVFWIFGGHSVGNWPIKTPHLDDIWKFDPSTLSWTWVSGHNNDKDNDAYMLADYKVKGLPGGKPGQREDATGFLDTDGNFLLYGGYGYGRGLEGGMDDLWKYNVKEDTWTWITGNDVVNTSPVYVPRNAISTTASPGARRYPSAGIDPQGNIWLFGGVTLSGYYNDTWTWALTTLLPTTPITLTGVMQKGNVNLQWNVEGLVNFDKLELQKSTNATDFTNLYSSTEGNASTFTDTNPVQGANYYRLKITQGNNIIYSKLVVIRVVPDVIEKIQLYPNPAHKYLLVDGLSLVACEGFAITDNLGRVVQRKELATKNASLRVDLQSLAPGWYILQLYTDTGVLNYKFIKQ